MDKKKQPGIRFVKVLLTKFIYELPKVKPEEFRYDFVCEDAFKIKGKTLICTLNISLYEKFSIEVTGVFETIDKEKNMELEKFANVNAPALLMPFAREVISSITSRTPLPHLLLPPINIVAIKKDLKKKSKKKEVSKQKALKVKRD